MPSLVLLTCANSARPPLSMLNTTNPVVAQYAHALTFLPRSLAAVGFEPPPRRARQYDACRRGEIDSPARDTDLSLGLGRMCRFPRALARRVGKGKGNRPMSRYRQQILSSA